MIGGLSADGPSRVQANASTSTAIWTPTTGAWDTGPALLKAHMAHAAVASPSNEISVIGGSTSASEKRAFAPFSADVEAVGDKTTTPRAPMAIARAYHTANLLQDGKVMVIGGTESGGNLSRSLRSMTPKKI
ncbi:hypothetical protein OY671_011334, partial [Metschnikowia pulcherrima]